MIKRDFKPPGLQYRNKWSENFHEFLKFALQKEPRKRPTAAELLKVEYNYYYMYTSSVEHISHAHIVQSIELLLCAWLCIIL